MSAATLLNEFLGSIFTIYTVFVCLLGAMGLISFYYGLPKKEFPREKKLALLFGIFDISLAVIFFIGAIIK